MWQLYGLHTNLEVCFGSCFHKQIQSFCWYKKNQMVFYLLTRLLHKKIETASYLCYCLLILVMFLFKLSIPKKPVTNSDQFSRTYLWECSPWCFLLSSLLKGPGSVLYCFVGVEVEDIFYVISHIFIIFYPNFLYYFVHKNKTVKRSHSWSSFWKARKVAKHYIIV